MILIKLCAMKSNQIQPPTPAPFQNLSQLGIETLQLSKLYYYAFFYNISSFWVSGVTYIRRVSSARTLQKGYLPQLKNINKCLPKFAFYPNNTASRFYFAPFSLKRASGWSLSCFKDPCFFGKVYSSLLAEFSLKTFFCM